jgi:hypothetical protein
MFKSLPSIYTDQYSDLSTLAICIIFLSAFIIAPFPSIIIAIYFIILTQTTNRKYFYVLIVMLSFFLGLINSTKVPQSDLQVYYSSFLSIGSVKFKDYVFNSSHSIDTYYEGIEPMYYLISYFIYHIFGNNFSNFILILSVVGYLFLFGSIYNYFNYIGANTLSIITAICILAFFNQYFYITAHLVRQVLAFSIIMYCIIEKAVYNRNRYLLIVCSVLIHSSTLFFIPLICLSIFKKNLSFKTILILLIFIISSLMFAEKILKILFNVTSFSSTLNYSFARLISGTFDDGLTLNKLYLYIVCLPLLIIVFSQILINKQTKTGTIFLFNVFIWLCLLVFFTNGAPLIQYRFFFMIYCFMPLILPHLFLKNSYLSKIGNLALIILFVGRFFVTYSDAPWQYAPMDKLLTNNYLTLFLSSYY